MCIRDRTRTLLILDQEEMIEAKDLIDDVLPTLESDFGIKLTIFFGNVWCKFQADDLPAFYREESRLFTNMRYFRGNERTVSFSQMLLLACLLYTSWKHNNQVIQLIVFTILTVVMRLETFATCTLNNQLMF